jgi:GNAT superfamily N-acetyltransferase
MGAQALEIRFAGEEDAASVSSILVEAASWVAARGMPLWPIEQLSGRAIAADIAAGRFVLATMETQAIATLRLTREDPECWPDAVPGVALYVHRIAVRRAWAGRGLVGILLAWCEKQAAALGCSQVRLDCDSGRTKLRALYEDLDFRFHSEQRVGTYTVVRYEREVRRAR